MTDVRLNGKMPGSHSLVDRFADQLHDKPSTFFFIGQATVAKRGEKINADGEDAPFVELRLTWLEHVIDADDLTAVTALNMRMYRSRTSKDTLFEFVDPATGDVRPYEAENVGEATIPTPDEVKREVPQSTSGVSADPFKPPRRRGVRKVAAVPDDAA